MADEDLEMELVITPDTGKMAPALAWIATELDKLSTATSDKFSMKGMAGSIARAATGGVSLGEMGGGAGQAIGEMFGGPIGGEVGKIIGQKLGEILPASIAAPAKLANDALMTLGHTLSELGGSLGPIGAGFDLLTAGANKIGDVVKSIPIVGQLLGPMMDQITMVPGIVKDIVATLTGFAAKASPAVFKQFQVAIEDVQGVIGQRFVPVLEVMTDFVRLFGDVLHTILPDIQTMRAMVAPIRMFFSALREELNLLFRMFGFGGLSSSFGAAAQPAQIGGALDYQRHLQTAAYSQPGTVTSANMPSVVGNIRDLLARLVGIEQGGWNAELRRMIGADDPNGARQAVAFGQQALRGPGRGVFRWIFG